MGMMYWVFRSRHSWLCIGGLAGACWVMFLLPAVPWAHEPWVHAMKMIAVAGGGCLPLFGAILDACLERYFAMYPVLPDYT